MNLWHILVVVSVLIMVIVGRAQYRLVVRRHKLRIENCGTGMRHLVVGILTVVFATTFFKESWWAVMQIYDGSSLSFASFAVVIPVGIMIYACILNVIGELAASMRLSALREERSRRLRRMAK